MNDILYTCPALFSLMNGIHTYISSQHVTLCINEPVIKIVATRDSFQVFRQESYGFT